MLGHMNRNLWTAARHSEILRPVLNVTFILLCGPVQAEGWQAVTHFLGRQGDLQGEIFRVTIPRNDLNVSIKGIPLEPELGLTNWFTFKPLAKGCLLRGQLVLLEGEARKTIARLEKRGFQTNPLPLQFPNMNPPIQYVEISGQGSGAHLAEVLRESLPFLGPLPVVSLTPQVESIPKPSLTPTPPIGKPVLGNYWSKIESLLGPGQPFGDCLLYEVPVRERIQERGVEIPPAMGMETRFRFQKVRGMALSGGRFMGLFPSSTPSHDVVAVMGEFLVNNGEEERISKSLSKNHFLVAAICPVPWEDNPRHSFLHFWALGDPAEIAGGLKTALNLMATDANP